MRIDVFLISSQEAPHCPWLLGAGVLRAHVSPGAEKPKPPELARTWVFREAQANLSTASVPAGAIARCLQRLMAFSKFGQKEKQAAWKGHLSFYFGIGVFFCFI